MEDILLIEVEEEYVGYRASYQLLQRHATQPRNVHPPVSESGT